MLRAGVLVAMMLALTALMAPLDAQCAMCRRVLESGEGRALAAVLRQAIVLLLVAPFAVIAIIGTIAVRMRRRTRPPA